ncbi:MAG: T9SS type A sorting domain-containing protein, partial [Bacteroidota bacterium]
LESMPGSSAPCHDLNGDGQVSVYDAALAMWCINTPHAPHPAGANTNECNFPRNILNPNDTAALAITTVDFTNGFMDIEIRSSDSDIKAYQFTVSGINPSSVVSLADPIEFPVDIRLINGGTSLFAISRHDSTLMRSASPQPLCRIYFSAVTDSVICIDNIRDIVNQNTERVVTYVYGGCVPTGSNGVSDVSANSVFQIAPNPVQHQLHLQVKQYTDGLSYSISDPSGRIVIGETAINSPTVTIETSGLSSGVYLLQLHSNGQTFMRRFNKL